MSDSDQSDRLAGLDPSELISLAMENPAAEDDDTNPGVTDFPAVPGYKISAQIGRGGMGNVYRATQLSLGREVAIKQVLPVTEAPAMGQFYQRFEREAQVLASLNHPNIVAVYDYVPLTDGGAVLVLELIEGGTLQDILQNRSPLEAAEAAEMIRSIGAGLEAAHEAGIIHRDLKPANVLIAANGVAKVSDFGLAMPITTDAERLTVTGVAVGTPGSMSPEQLAGGEIDQRADIYSLGVIAYQMLTGILPHGNFDPPSGEGISEVLSDSIMRALRPDPAERFSSMAEWLELLSSPTDPAIGRPKSASKKAPGRRKWLKTAALGTAAVAGIAAGSAWVFSDRREWKELLDDVSPDHDSIAGTWRRYGSHIQSYGLPSPHLLSIRDPWTEASYDLRMRFSRLEGNLSVGLFFPTSAGPANCDLCYYGTNRGTVQWVDGLSGREQPESQTFPVALVNGSLHELQVAVRPDEVRVIFDGDPQLTLPIAGKTLSIEPPWAGQGYQISGIAIGSYESPTRFESLAWC